MASETDRLNAALAKHLKDTGITDRVCPVHGSNALLDADDEGVWRCVEITGLHDICWEKAVVAEVARDYCGSLDRAVTALNALGLEWACYPTYGTVHVIGPWDAEGEAPRDVETCHATDATPAALKTALVQAALALLGEEDASCPD